MSSDRSTLDARTIWNAKDRDNPVPAFAALRALGAVHRVELDDGVEAWCIVRYDDAKAALNDPRLSKDMHAALRASGTVVSEPMSLALSPDGKRLAAACQSKLSIYEIMNLQ